MGKVIQIITVKVIHTTLFIDKGDIPLPKFNVRGLAFYTYPFCACFKKYSLPLMSWKNMQKGEKGINNKTCLRASRPMIDHC